MKFSNITNLDLIKILESSTELFRNKVYFDKRSVEAFIGLAVHRSNFYGTKKGDELIPLKRNQTTFNSSEDIVLVVEGVVKLDKEPVNEGTGGVVYDGYGIVEVNGNPIFNGTSLIDLGTDDILNDSTVPGTNATQAIEAVDSKAQSALDVAFALNASKLDRAGYTGSAQTLKNEIDALAGDIQDFGDATFKVTYYEIINISSGTSGSLGFTPSQATISTADEFGESGEAVLSRTVGNLISGKPNFETPRNGHTPVTVTLDGNGNWVASDTHPNPVAVIYKFTIQLEDWSQVNTSLLIDYYKAFDYSKNGFLDYNDTTGSFSITADTWTDLPNDGAGAFTNKNYRPTGVTELIDVSTGYIDPTELDLGDTILIRNDYTINPNTNNAQLRFRYALGNGGGSYTLEKIVGRLDSGSGQDYRFSLSPDLIYMGDTNTRDNPIKIQVYCTSNATVTNAGSVIQVIKR